MEALSPLQLHLTMANDNVAVQEKEVLVPELGAKQAKPMLWKQNETFLPQQPVQEQNESFQQSANDHEAHKSWKPVDYFNKYINDDVYKMLADATNQTAGPAEWPFPENIPR